MRAKGLLGQALGVGAWGLGVRIRSKGVVHCLGVERPNLNPEP